MDSFHVLVGSPSAFELGYLTFANFEFVHNTGAATTIPNLPWNVLSTGDVCSRRSSVQTVLDHEGVSFRIDTTSPTPQEFVRYNW